MVQLPTRMFPLIVALTLIACDSKGAPEGSIGSQPESTSERTTPTSASRPSTTESTSTPVDSWEGIESPSAATFSVSRVDGRVWLSTDDRILDIVPTLETSWIDDDGKTKKTTTRLSVKSLDAGSPYGFSLPLEGEDELGRWSLRVENTAGDPHINFELDGTYQRDAMVVRQEVVFELPGDSAPHVLLRTGAFSRADGERASHSTTPQWVRWPERNLTYRGGRGVDGYRVAPSSEGWTQAVQTFDAELYPGNDSNCDDAGTSSSFSRREKGSTAQAQWQFVAGIFDSVRPTNFANGALGGVAVVIDDAEPGFEQTKTLDIGVPTVDSDGALELGMFYTRAVSAGEPLASLGGLARTAHQYGVEYVPRGGDEAAKTFRDRFGAVTWWGEGKRGCEEFGGKLEERVEQGYRFFFDGRQFDGLDVLDPSLVARGAGLHLDANRSDPYSPTLFGATPISGSEALSAAVQPEKLDALKEARGLAILHTSIDDWVMSTDDGHAVIPASKGAMLMLTRYRNERRMSVGPVRKVVGHAAAMRSVLIEEFPDGWVRVHNPTDRQIQGASFELPADAAAHVPGAKAKTREGVVSFDLPAGGEQFFQVTGVSEWVAPIGIKVGSPE